MRHGFVDEYVHAHHLYSHAAAAFHSNHWHDCVLLHQRSLLGVGMSTAVFPRIWRAVAEAVEQLGRAEQVRLFCVWLLGAIVESDSGRQFPVYLH